MCPPPPSARPRHLNIDSNSTPCVLITINNYRYQYIHAIIGTSAKRLGWHGGSVLSCGSGGAAFVHQCFSNHGNARVSLIPVTFRRSRLQPRPCPPSHRAQFLGSLISRPASVSACYNTISRDQVRMSPGHYQQFWQSRLLPHRCSRPGSRWRK